MEEENKVLELNNKLLAFSEDLAKRYKSDIDKMTQLSEVITENIEILEKAITELGKFRERLLNEMKKYKYKNYSKFTSLKHISGKDFLIYLKNHIFL